MNDPEKPKPPKNVIDFNAEVRKRKGIKDPEPKVPLQPGAMRPIDDFTPIEAEHEIERIEQELQKNWNITVKLSKKAWRYDRDQGTRTRLEFVRFIQLAVEFLDPDMRVRMRGLTNPIRITQDGDDPGLCYGFAEIRMGRFSKYERLIGFSMTNSFRDFLKGYFAQS